MANNNHTFGELLHSLNNNLLKNEIRNIEKLNNFFLNIKNGIRFNETCIKEGLYPKFTNIYDSCNMSCGNKLVETYTKISSK